MRVGTSEGEQVSRKLNFRQVKSQLDADVRRVFLTGGVVVLIVGFALQAASEFLVHGVGFYVEGITGFF